MKYFKNTSWLFAGIWVARYLGPEQVIDLNTFNYNGNQFKWDINDIESRLNLYIKVLKKLDA